MEENKLKLDPMPINLCHTLEESIEIVSLEAARKEIELICEIDPSVPVSVAADPIR